MFRLNQNRSRHSATRRETEPSRQRSLFPDLWDRQERSDAHCCVTMILCLNLDEYVLRNDLQIYISHICEVPQVRSLKGDVKRTLATVILSSKLNQILLGYFVPIDIVMYNNNKLLPGGLSRCIGSNKTAAGMQQLMERLNLRDNGAEHQTYGISCLYYMKTRLFGHNHPKNI